MTARVPALAAALFAVGLFMTVAVINVPHDASDRELVAWWSESGNQLAGVFSGMWAIVTAVTFAVVVNHLRSSALAARSPRWRDFAASMGTAVTALWLVTGAARAAIGHLVTVMDEPLPGPDVLRFATALNYALLGLSGMTVLSLCILATSVLALRTGMLARWVGVTGLVCGAVVLAASVAQYGAYSVPVGILWALCLAVAIWRQPASAE
jgi:chromate transport protein ChrA